MGDPTPSSTAGCCHCNGKPEPPREIVLCFDGTGNTLGEGGETNILKIFRVLDRTKENRSGIGTESAPVSFGGVPLNSRSSLLGSSKVLDMALASSFDQHVLGGYRFLMRRYKPGAKIYLFGFSRGAYTARFLSEMVDYTGLPKADNEELVPLIWKAFWTFRFRSEKKHHTERYNAYRFLRTCRETLCNPVSRTHFLGLFDTVNSVAELKQECEGVPTARIIRHAVSIDERRLKFQPVLISPRIGNRGNWLLEKNRKDQKNKGKDAADDVDSDSDDEDAVDLEEVYFAGDHSDVGGGHELEPAEMWPASHVPLVWMLGEAAKAGLTFNDNRLVWELGSEVSEPLPETIENENSSRKSPVIEASLNGVLHNSLDFDDSKNKMLTLFWRLLEILPFKRLHSQPDGSQKLSRRPVRGGLARAIPRNSRVHGSVVTRLRKHNDYKPTNLTGVAELRDAKNEAENWVCVDKGQVGEFWMRKEERLASR
ncbi:hypothetical protein AJ79_04835 [Helicocarpus griseus UAMH5409]|uniref:T6SS Phospholipase effector Tle1-like catalytic domain-containing protein n=1 Tax=Helicocarpus griseus UAMH5409 TaxID=1447875 RepID=A0A2B7XR62_9EURO|nr:hypothetical protein AJ79_04835 [Helicocarpus griseus UAMH5409]